jgi:hypothetical protein
MLGLFNPSNQNEQVQIPDSDQIRNIENQILAIENRMQANGASMKDFNDLEFMLLELKALNEKEDRRIKKDFDISDIENIPCSKAWLVLKKGLYYLRSLFDQ